MYNLETEELPIPTNSKSILSSSQLFSNREYSTEALLNSRDLFQIHSKHCHLLSDFTDNSIYKVGISIHFSCISQKAKLFVIFYSETFEFDKNLPYFYCCLSNFVEFNDFSGHTSYVRPVLLWWISTTVQNVTYFLAVHTFPCTRIGLSGS